MILTKTIVVDRFCLSELMSAIVLYSVNLNGRITKEQYYTIYILQRLYTQLKIKEAKLSVRANAKIRLKFDCVQALALTDVLQHCKGSFATNNVLMELGTIIPNTSEQSAMPNIKSASRID